MAYIPVEWNTGDVITAAKLNSMDSGIVGNETSINDLIENLDTYFANSHLTGTIPANATVTANPSFTPEGYSRRLLVIGHSSYAASRGIYIILPNAVTPVMSADNAIVTMNEGVLSITNNYTGSAMSYVVI